MSLTIGVDIGGTKILAGTVAPDGSILATARRPTPRQDPGAVLATVADVVAELVTSSSEPIEAIGTGVAGGVDADRSRVYFAPNLRWSQVPVRALLEESTGLPVVVENDGNAAAWGEYRFGAGRGARDMVLATVGTGIGGGIVIDGALFRGAHGAAAEIGHITVVRGGRSCGCGRSGCWEQYASGNALVREARELAADRRADADLLLSLGDGTPEGISGVEVTEAARVGDPVAIEAFTRVGTWLGHGLADLAAVLDPEVFVIGGGVSESGDLLMASARVAMIETLIGGGNRPAPEVRLAELANSAGLVGAANLARDRALAERAQRA